MSNKKQIKNQKGFNMINLLLYMAGAAILLGGSIALWNDWQIENSGDEIAEFVIGVKPDVTRRYPTEVATMDTDTMVELDFARDNEVTDATGTRIVLKDGVEVTLAANTALTASVLSFNPVRDSVCVNALGKIWDQGTPIEVNGTTVKAAETDTITGNSALIDANCSGNANQIDLELTASI